jgi:replicative superfamily II helicase
LGEIFIVDYKKLLGKEELTLETDPIKIFENLDKESTIGDLRSSQKNVLSSWYKDYKDEKDIIVKLPTGQGKTLIGLLLLQSILNERKEPAIYLCPNKYLVTQTITQAKTFGIKTVEFESGSSFPIEFLNAEAILVTTCSKVFNGKSVFGLRDSIDNAETIPGAILMDDAHKCLDIIRESFSFTINKYQENEDSEKTINPIYKQLWDLFKSSLRYQGHGTCIDIENGDNCFLAVPFWKWQDNIKDIIAIFADNKDNEDIKFSWNLLKNELINCNCVISGRKIEISPRLIPISQIPTFDKAPKRFFMSATLTEDSFLVRDLGIDSESVKHPLRYKELKYSGERLILFPTNVNTALDRINLIKWITDLSKRYKNFGVVSIVPSYYKANDWGKLGGTIATSSDVMKKIALLNGKINLKLSDDVLVLLNAYDGIDLPDDTCRILVLDSFPDYSSLMAKYTQKVRGDSKFINRQISQRIEQGMGRAIRGISDWCVVIVIGNTLTNFFSERKKRQYLSEEAQKQIEIGDTLTSAMIDEGATVSKIEETIQQSIDRDAGWKEFYKQEMSKLSDPQIDEEYLTNSVLEREAEVHYLNGQLKKTIPIIDQLIADSKSDDDRGWYLQLKAAYLYNTDTTNSMDVQIKAYETNSRLSKPESGLRYSKIDERGRNRAELILDYVNERESRNSLILNVDLILDKIHFGVDSDRFEEGIKEVGELLGFTSERPEKKISDGPDNLWFIGNKTYWIIECKNQVNSNREEIYKSESGQMQNSISWFEKTYEGSTGKPIFIHPSNMLSRDAHLRDAAWVMNEERLDLLKDNIYSFYKSLPDKKSLTEAKIIEKLTEYKLSNSYLNRYLERVLEYTAR